MRYADIMAEARAVFMASDRSPRKRHDRTERDIAILRALRSGASVEEVAERYGLSPKTVAGLPSKPRVRALARALPPASEERP